jgi:hypothetical protein
MLYGLERGLSLDRIPSDLGLKVFYASLTSMRDTCLEYVILNNVWRTHC